MNVKSELHQNGPPFPVHDALGEGEIDSFYRVSYPFIGNIQDFFLPFSKDILEIFIHGYILDFMLMTNGVNL